MSSSSLPSPLTTPLEFKRKSSSAFSHISMDDHMYGLDDPVSSSSPPLSSSPLLTPLHLTRRYDCTEWQTGDDLDDLYGAMYGSRDRFEDVSCPLLRDARPDLSRRPLPSLMSKFTAHGARSDLPLSYYPSPFSLRTTYFYPEGDSTVADAHEEHDLESMDIHIHETYFVTSAERGRWLSSPVAPRVRAQAIPPMRGCSSPIRTLIDASPLKESLHRRNRSCSVDKQVSISLPEDRDGDPCRLSSLPPSSPLTSPMSNLSFLGDDYGDHPGDNYSNSEDSHFLTRTPKSSNPTTTCTPLIEPVCMPATHEVPEVDPPLLLALHPTDVLCHSAGSTVSRHTSPNASHSPKPIDAHVHASDTTSFKLEEILSPLSQFELDTPEAGPSKLPLSDTVNRPYPGQQIAGPGTVDTALSQNGPSCVQSLSTNSDREPCNVPFDIVGESSSNTRAKKRRERVTGDPGVRQMRERAVVRSGSPSFGTKKGKGSGGHTSSRSEPPGKKPKLSHCNSENRRAKSHPRLGGIRKVNRHSRSSSHRIVEGSDSESACPPVRKTAKSTGHAQLQQPMPGSCSTLDPTDRDNAEFHASLTGMLIEAFATSRATSMDSATLHLVLTQAHPYLAAERSKEELLSNIAAVLEAGRARCGMFEKVDSSGESSRHGVLESRWFYVAERDEDGERASLISAMMPRQKRNETKKYKQYYYRPLGKISRWDPEDAP